MTDLAVLALQCQQTQVITYMLGNGTSDRPLHDIGVSMGHHELSHSTWDEGYSEYGRWALGKFVRLVQNLPSVQEPDGSRLLDYTHVLFLGSMGNGGIHSRSQLPVLLAGPGITPGHLASPAGTPIANLYTSLAHAFGMPISTFGDDATGSLVDVG
jgi:hypothetical protein